MTGTRASLNRRKLKTPRAAAIAGILFAVLFGTGLVLIRLSVPADQAADSAWLDTNSKTLALALNLVPYAGIAFLWFISVIRDRLGKPGIPLLCDRVPGQRLALPGYEFRRWGLSRRIFDQLRAREKRTVC